MGILNNIRQKSDNQKKILALALALILTFFIVGLWFSFSNKTADNQVAEQKENKLSSLSPLQVIKDEFSKAFSNFKETTGEISTTTSSSIIPIEIIETQSTSSEQATSTEESI